jgi:hypothetical protein
MPGSLSCIAFPNSRLRGRRRPEGNEQVRIVVSSDRRLFAGESPYGDQSDRALAAIQWLEPWRQREVLKLVFNRPVRTRMLGGVGGGPEQSGPLSRFRWLSAN